MAIDQTDKVDFISIDENDKSVFLTISDHLDWTNVEGHLLMLQEKINNYITFYESEQLYEEYPKAKNKRIVFNIIAKEEFPPEAVEFLCKIKAFLDTINIELRFGKLDA